VRRVSAAHEGLRIVSAGKAGNFVKEGKAAIPVSVPIGLPFRRARAIDVTGLPMESVRRVLARKGDSSACSRATLTGKCAASVARARANHARSSKR
jgi:hypothetical protein